jgi:hypothetical protein
MGQTGLESDDVTPTDEDEYYRNLSQGKCVVRIPTDRMTLT